MTISIAIYADQMYRHHRIFSRIFAEGLKRHGYSFSVRNNRDYTPTDLAVIWGHRQHEIQKGQRSRGLDYLVMERGYIGDRFKYTSMGYNGLNGKAEHHAQDMPHDRWQVHRHLLKPWHDGNYVLIMGQVAGDASIAHTDIIGWYKRTYETCKFVFGDDMPIYFRPHPCSRVMAPELPHLRVLAGDLKESLSRAHCAVVYNSNSGVDAVLAGTPIIACDRGTMAWPMARHTFGTVMNKPDREQWAADVCYCQWRDDEIEDGTAWDHLKVRYENPNYNSATG